MNYFFVIIVRNRKAVLAQSLRLLNDTACISFLWLCIPCRCHRILLSTV